MPRFIVMTAAAKMPSSCKFGRYARVAVIETDGVTMPKQINPKHNCVKSIPFLRDRLFVGKTDKCAFALAKAEAHRVADELNAAQPMVLF